jgi:superfamily II DNA or RNA helicase
MPADKLYDFQAEAVESVAHQFEAADSTLVVAPTGCGKTQIGAAVARDTTLGRVMWVAHREELINQAAERLAQFCPSKRVGIEMAEQRTGEGLFLGEDIVVATFQTLMSNGRMDKFRPQDFSLLVIDEAHRSTARSYLEIKDHFHQSKLLGLTATPNRTDESALGEVFESVAFAWDYRDAREQGWLVPVTTKGVVIESLDLTRVRVRGGDYVESDLIKAMGDRDRVLYECALAIRNLKPAKTLIFCSGVQHAEDLSNILKEEGLDSEVVTGGTPKEERRDILKKFDTGSAVYLCNCAVLTEGYDCPSIERIVMARPTTSDLLYRQMLGRGCRVLPGVLTGREHGDPDDRIRAIAASSKPNVEIIDLVPRNAKFKPITAVTALAGTALDEEAEAAELLVQDPAAEAMEIDAALEAARQQLSAQAMENRRNLDQITRGQIKFTGEVRFETVIDYENALDVSREREPGWYRGKRITPNQVRVLERAGVPFDPTTTTLHQASQIIDRLIARRKALLATPKQMLWMQKKNAVPEGWKVNQITFADAKIILDEAFSR